MLQPIRTHNADRAATHEAIGHLKEKLGRSVCILGIIIRVPKLLGIATHGEILWNLRA